MSSLELIITYTFWFGYLPFVILPIIIGFLSNRLSPNDSVKFTF